MRLGGWLRRYDPHSGVGGRMQSLALYSSISVWGVRQITILFLFCSPWFMSLFSLFAPPLLYPFPSF